jgi:hypothetical protein
MLDRKRKKQRNEEKQLCVAMEERKEGWEPQIETQTGAQTSRFSLAPTLLLRIVIIIESSYYRRESFSLGKDLAAVSQQEKKKWSKLGALSAAD